MGISRQKNMHLIKLTGAAADPILRVLRWSTPAAQQGVQGGGHGARKILVAELLSVSAGQRRGNGCRSVDIPDLGTSARRLICPLRFTTSPPRETFYTSSSCYIYTYIYVRVKERETERTISTNCTKVKCSFLMPPALPSGFSLKQTQKKASDLRVTASAAIFIISPLCFYIRLTVKA